MRTLCHSTKYSYIYIFFTYRTLSNILWELRCFFCNPIPGTLLGNVNLLFTTTLLYKKISQRFSKAHSSLKYKSINLATAILSCYLFHFFYQWIFFFNIFIFKMSTKYIKGSQAMTNYKASHGAGAQACDCEHELRVRFLLEEIIFLIFSFLGSGVEAKRGVNFRH